MRSIAAWAAAYPASRTQRNFRPEEASAGAKSTEDVILVGAKEYYEARCRFCHEPEINQLSFGEMAGTWAKAEPAKELAKEFG